METDALTKRAPENSDQADGFIDEKRLTITGHLDELRRRLWVGIGVVLFAFAANFAWAGKLIEWLKRPAGSALERLAFFQPTEAIVAYMKVAFFAGIFMSVPVLLYEAWAFIRPGLNKREGGLGLVFICFGSILFIAGGAFAYYVLLPVCLTFLLGFAKDQLIAVISISHYLSFTASVLLACGFVFQMPLVVFLLAKVGVLSHAVLRRKRSFALIGMLVLAAVLTPTTDVATMLFMTLPMLFLYEVSIWIAYAAGRSRQGG